MRDPEAASDADSDAALVKVRALVKALEVEAALAKVRARRVRVARLVALERGPFADEEAEAARNEAEYERWLARVPPVEGYDPVLDDQGVRADERERTIRGADE